MKHKVKLVGVKGEIITLKVDGVPCAYFIQRPTPLTSQDSFRLRTVMDTRMLESLLLTSLPGNFVSRLVCKLRGLSGAVLVRTVRTDGHCFDELVSPGNVPKSFGEAVADYIKKVGVEMNIDKKTKGIVILKSDVDKIKEGRV